jgi:hypothetical protein
MGHRPIDVSIFPFFLFFFIFLNSHAPLLPFHTLCCPKPSGLRRLSLLDFPRVLTVLTWARPHEALLELTVPDGARPSPSMATGARLLPSSAAISVSSLLLPRWPPSPRRRRLPTPPCSIGSEFLNSLLVHQSNMLSKSGGLKFKPRIMGLFNLLQIHAAPDYPRLVPLSFIFVSYDLWPEITIPTFYLSIPRASGSGHQEARFSRAPRSLLPFLSILRFSSWSDLRCFTPVSSNRLHWQQKTVVECSS